MSREWTGRGRRGRREREGWCGRRGRRGRRPEVGLSIAEMEPRSGRAGWPGPTQSRPHSRGSGAPVVGDLRRAVCESGGQLGWGEPWLDASALYCRPAHCRSSRGRLVSCARYPCAMRQGDWVGAGGRQYALFIELPARCSLVEDDSRRQPPHRITHTPAPLHPDAASAARGADDRGWRWRWQEGAAHMTLRSGCRSLASVHRTSVRVGVCVWPVPCVQVWRSRRSAAHPHPRRAISYHPTVRSGANSQASPRRSAATRTSTRSTLVSVSRHWEMQEEPPARARTDHRSFCLRLFP